MDIETKVRELAKTQYWQSIYSSSKDCTGINLFENCSNFSGIQVMFLYWLRVYSLLNEELHNQEWSNLNDKVIADNTHCDAFLYWRGKELDKRTREYKSEERKSKNNKGKKFDEEKSFKIFQGPSKK